MGRVRGVFADVIEALGVRVDMHIGPAVAAAVGWITNVYLKANAETQILIMFAVAIATRELVDLVRSGKRREAERMVAATARRILDQHLDLTRTDRVHRGDFMNLRRMARRVRAGSVGTVVSFGGPAQTLSRLLLALRTSFETDVSRCYGRMRPRAKDRIDAFGDALKDAATIGQVMIHLPNVPVEEREAAHARLLGTMRQALVLVEKSGNDLDRHLDRGGYHVAAQRREKEDVAQKEREWDAAEVLYANAVEAVQAIYELGEPPNDDDVSEWVRRLRKSRDIALAVDAESYRSATDEVRATHRRIAYGDLSESLQILEHARDGKPDGRMAKVRELVGHLSPDLSYLDALRSK